MDIRVVIPCYNEPDVLSTIKSLFDSSYDNLKIEVVVVVNSYIISSQEVKDFNKKTFFSLEEYASNNNTINFILTPLFYENLPGHQTGAGLPRKLGMDKAVEDYFLENNPSGIVVSLDADCIVEENYFKEIYDSFKKRKLKSATIQFHHLTGHLLPDDKIRIATEIYEEYLRYYRAALEYTGYPYSYYTIGSAFAVTAQTYKMVGGMGKQQAGEDFYFLQKVFPLGKTHFISTTKVYPAARISNRVPFGTGPSIEKMIKSGQFNKLTYQVKAFDEIKLLFDSIDLFFCANKDVFKASCIIFPKHLLLFLEREDFYKKIEEINRHTATLPNFRKRFFAYFNAFKILKYMNYVHPSLYELADMKEQYLLLRNKFSDFRSG